MGTRATHKLRFTSGHEVMAYFLGRQYFSDYPYEGAHKLKIIILTWPVQLGLKNSVNAIVMAGVWNGGRI